jgi:hypothetical protein
VKNIFYTIFIIFIINQVSLAEISIKIIGTTGDSKVRFGLDEKWHKASIGLELKEIDTILTGEDGEIVLQFEGGKKFVLGNNSILDIGDLREIQEKELFLFLMSKKVENIQQREQKTKLRIGDVSLVYGESKGKTDSIQADNNQKDLGEKEINGALALYIQKYYTNTLYKLHNLIDKYKSKINMGKVHFYIAKAFEALDKKGQAMDAYQNVIDYFETTDSLNHDDQKYLIESKNAIKLLNKRIKNEK